MTTSAIPSAFTSTAAGASRRGVAKVPKASSVTADKKLVQKLQRAIVDGLEDVKAQQIVVFDTEQLSPLFERVIVASGTSNRQTKALAASVVDAVREAGFAKPRVEGEDNGEWIIVDCGVAVVHVMQPNIRAYYNLEEIWGEKPVRLKFGADKPAAASRPLPATKVAAEKTPAKKVVTGQKKAPGKVTSAKAAPGKAVTTKAVSAKATKSVRPTKPGAAAKSVRTAKMPRTAAKKSAPRKA